MANKPQKSKDLNVPLLNKSLEFVRDLDHKTPKLV